MPDMVLKAKQLETEKWWQLIPPKTAQWFEIGHEICNMERLKYMLGIQIDRFHDPL